jgi:hypothetical protein
MPYRYPAARIHKIFQAPKVLAEGQSVKPKKQGSHGLGSVSLDFPGFHDTLPPGRRTP